MRRTTGAAAVLGTAAGVLLSGCGPSGPLPLVAVERDATGALVAVLRPCGDDVITGLSLFGARDDDPEKNRSGWEARDERRGTDAEFPLFSPPAAWHPTPVGRQRVLPGYRYELSFGKAVPDYEYSGTVTFTAKDLAAVKPGQVRADGRVMSLGEFEKLAEDSC
ncbi:hypothetical protein ACFV2H_21780 [Streptomyces sp. NPDC059629]|uniref:hypothetical protein n=1 Tax=Streptomyces sp. NPDC059629 TaxID=3346889 RepID=UPI00367F47BD